MNEYDNGFNKGFEEGVRFALNQAIHQLTSMQPDIAEITLLYKRYKL